MKQMGIAQEEIPTSKVTIEKQDGSNIIINNPSVTKIKMQGQETFQIAGDISEEIPKLEISQEDINTVMQQTNCNESKAKDALEETGDLADAILKLRE